MQVSNSLKNHRKANQKNMDVLSCQAVSLTGEKLAQLTPLTKSQESIGQCRDYKRWRDLIGGADADRTRDLLNAIQALSQTELQPHRRRDFSANPMHPVESTEHRESPQGARSSAQLV
jgi:hypothetical protein